MDLWISLGSLGASYSSNPSMVTKPHHTTLHMIFAIVWSMQRMRGQGVK
jgi:hypothetical protein